MQPPMQASMPPPQLNALNGSDSFNRRANGGGPFYGLSRGPKRTGKGGDNQSSMPWTYNQGTASGGTTCGRGKSGKPSDEIADYGACCRTSKRAAGKGHVGRGLSSATMPRSKVYVGVRYIAKCSETTAS